jgi:hypothetical protein
MHAMLQAHVVREFLACLSHHARSSVLCCVVWCAVLCMQVKLFDHHVPPLQVQRQVATC